MDFLTYNGVGPSAASPPGPNIQPFAMYIFEFHHCLSKQDLIDIWQNLMPKIAMEAEKDESIITHDATDAEVFFDISKITKDTRWMIFKVKRRSEKSYYSVTEVEYDDSRFRFQIGQSKIKPDYYYNWPYDFFSLVELVKVEADLKWKEKV